MKPNPGYGDFLVKEGWAYARKMQKEFNNNQYEVRKEVVYQKEYIGLCRAVIKIARRLVG